MVETKKLKKVEPEKKAKVVEVAEVEALSLATNAWQVVDEYPSDSHTIITKAMDMGNGVFRHTAKVVIKTGEVLIEAMDFLPAAKMQRRNTSGNITYKIIGD